jgi:hypothetical protein
MQCEQLTERLADYWAGALSEADRAAFEAHVATCPECRREAAALGETWRSLGTLRDEEPSPALQQRFDAMLDAFQAGTNVTSLADWSKTHAAATNAAPVKSRLFHPAWQMAAALLLVTIGFAAGRGWPDQAATHQIGELRGEVRGMREMVALALLQQDSAVERLRGVSWSGQMDQPGTQVLNALVDTLQHDPTVNVRLAAIDALQTFGREDRVRTALLDALQEQRSPLVQMALIDAMVDLRERRSVTVLRTMAGDAKANTLVRQRAERGLQQLSS